MSFEPDDDEIRGPADNPVAAFEQEVMQAIGRYADVWRAAPAWSVALLIEIVDSIRLMTDVDVEAKSLGDGMTVLIFEDMNDEMAAWVGVPRKGEYHDVDFEALSEQTGIDFEEGDISSEWRELADLDQFEGSA